MARVDEQIKDYSYTARKVLQIEGWSQRYAYNGDGLVEYQGFSRPGINVGTTAWAIKKFVYDGTNVTQVLWASSTANKFTHVWSGAGSVSTTYASYNYA